MATAQVAWGELCESGLLELLTRLLVPSFSEVGMQSDLHLSTFLCF